MKAQDAHRPRTGTTRALHLGLSILAVSCGSQTKPSSTMSEVDAGPPGPPGPASVLQEHLHPNGDGAYVDPKVTRAAAAALHLDPSFDATFDGISYGGMLYVDGLRSGVDALFVSSNTNHVTALDATTGQPIWDKVLGPIVIGSTIACHQPTVPDYGITSTPIIDASTRTLYVESFQVPPGGTPAETTYIYALSIDDGSVRKGWPVDVGKAVKGFDSTAHRPRASLALLNGTLYVPFASLYDSCTDYHGWVVGISTAEPTKVTSWSTSANRGGIWGGIVSDGKTLFTSTGNTAVGTKTWGGGEAVIHLSLDLAFSGKSTDYFAPSNWQQMDDDDLDLGSASPLLIDLPGAAPSTLIAAIGKEGVLHLLDRADLGGIGKGDGSTGEGLYSQKLINGQGVHGRGASYETAKGHYMVFRSNGTGIGCPNGTSGDLVALRLKATSPPTFSIAWCAVSNGSGSPVVTTTDGESEPIVWSPATGGTSRLYGFDGDTGALVYAGGGANDVMTTLWRWASPVIAKGRFYVAGTGKVHLFDAK